MKREIKNPYPDSEAECFFCGPESRDGLKLRFFRDEERSEISTEYVPERRFVGQGDILHGAIQMGLLDEIMGWTTVFESGQMAVTTAMSVKFLRPVYVCGKPVTATCRVVGQAARDIELYAELLDSEEAVCTTATSTYRLLPEERFKTLVRCG